MRKMVINKLVIPGLIVGIALGGMAYSHCQIPCGIYNDQMRFDMLSEHIATIEKSINQITELSGQPKPNYNQIVRWVTNKDEHADRASEIITYYFMAQRIKSVPETDTKAYNNYVKQLTLLHEMLVLAMKTKQTTDLSNIEQLRSLLQKFHDIYFAKTGTGG